MAKTNGEIEQLVPELAWDVYGSPYARWALSLGSGQIVYMSTTVGRYDSSAVVYVDAERFVRLWRRDIQQGELARGGATAWRRDSKFRYAEEGFAEGENNPVPLADVSCGSLIRPEFLWLKRRLPLALARSLPWPVMTH